MSFRIERLRGGANNTDQSFFASSNNKFCDNEGESCCGQLMRYAGVYPEEIREKEVSHENAMEVEISVFPLVAISWAFSQKMLN